jgi:hypothetical protein
MLILDSNTIFVRAEAVRVNEPGPGGALEAKAACLPTSWRGSARALLASRLMSGSREHAEIR